MSRRAKNICCALIVLGVIPACSYSKSEAPAKPDGVRSSARYDNHKVSKVDTESSNDSAAADPYLVKQPSAVATKKMGAARGPAPTSPLMANKGKGKSAFEKKPELPVPSTSNHTNEAYKNYGVNPLTDTTKDRFSTFSVDVDTASYTIARRKLNSGVVPPAAAVRVEEFVNYFGYSYPVPDAGAFGVSMEAAPSPFKAAKDRYLLRVGVQGKHIAPKDRKPVHLTFLIDVSGSMNRPDKLGLAKKSLKVLTDNLKPGDTVALATYAGRTAIKLKHTSVKNKAQIHKAIDDLTSSGGTAMNSGMKAAYSLAVQAKKPGHVSRVIVLSDGDANIGPTSHEDILRRIRGHVQEGVTLSTIGLGMGNYKDTLMEQLANKGNGNYYYIDSIKEAQKVFGSQVDGTLEVIAKDVKLQVEFNPKVVKSYRLIGYENRNIADKDFRNDQVDAGEIGAGHTVTAMYELVLQKGHSSFKGNYGYVRVRAKKPEGQKAKEQIFTLGTSQFKTKLNDASKDFQFAAAVTSFAEILRKSPYAEGLSHDLVHEVAKASVADRADRKAFLALVKKAKLLKK